MFPCLELLDRSKWLPRQWCYKPPHHQSVRRTLLLLYSASLFQERAMSPCLHAFLVGFSCWQLVINSRPKVSENICRVSGSCLSHRGSSSCQMNLEHVPKTECFYLFFSSKNVTELFQAYKSHFNLVVAFSPPLKYFDSGTGTLFGQKNNK